MPPLWRNKHTSSPANQGDRQRSHRIVNDNSNVTVTTTQPAKKQSPGLLDKERHPTIVQAVLEALHGPPSGPSDTTDPSSNPSSCSNPLSQVLGSFLANQPTTETQDPSIVQPLHLATEQSQSRCGGSTCFDPSECYLNYKHCVITMYAWVKHIFINIIIITMLYMNK